MGQDPGCSGDSANVFSPGPLNTSLCSLAFSSGTASHLVPWARKLSLILAGILFIRHLTAAPANFFLVATCLYLCFYCPLSESLIQILFWPVFLVSPTLENLAFYLVVVFENVAIVAWWLIYLYHQPKVARRYSLPSVSSPMPNFPF